MSTLQNDPTVAGDANLTKSYLGSVSPVFEYWCLDCDEFHEARELLGECPKCGSSVRDSLVQIYMEHDPEPDHYKTRADYMAGD